MHSEVLCLSGPSLDMNYNLKNPMLYCTFLLPCFRVICQEKRKQALSNVFIRPNISIGAYVYPSVTDVIFYKKTFMLLIQPAGFWLAEAV